MVTAFWGQEAVYWGPDAPAGSNTDTGTCPDRWGGLHTQSGSNGGSTKFGSLRSVVAVATCCCLCRLIDVFRSEVAACCARRNKGRLEVISSMYWPTRYLLAWIYCQPMCLSFRNCLTVVTNKKKKNVVRVFVGLLLLCNMVKIMLKHWREHKALLPTK